MSCGCCPNEEFVLGKTTGARMTRTQCRHPDIGPFFERQFVPTTTVPMPGQYGGGRGWAEVVDLESNLRRFENRSTHLADCNDIRNQKLPLSWTMDYLPHRWQQDDDYARHMEFSRLQVADIPRPRPHSEETPNMYDPRRCHDPYAVDQVVQHRLVG